MNRASIIWLALLLVLSGCGGSGSSGSAEDCNPIPGAPNSCADDTANPPPQVADLEAVMQRSLGMETACPALTPSVTSAVPGTRVVLSGVPSSFGEAGIRMIAAEPNADLISPIFVHDNAQEGTVSFTLPLHPTTAPEGGEVMLELGDGVQRCPQFAFTVEALPDAEADHALTIQMLLEEYVDTRLELLNIDPTAFFNADPATLETWQLGLWLAKQFVSGAAPEHLPALAQAASEDGDLFLERYLVALGMEQELDSLLIQLETVPVVGSMNTTANTDARGFARLLAAPGSGVAALNAQDCQDTAIQANPYNIMDIDQLAAVMSSGNPVSDAEGAIGQALGTAELASAPSNTSLGNKVGGTASFLGAQFFIFSSALSVAEALTPQSITGFQIDSVESPWVEDRPDSEPATWAPPQVSAQGEDFNLSRLSLQAAIAGAGLIPGPVGTSVTATTLLAGDQVNAAVDELTEDSCFRLQAPQYGPFPDSDYEYSTGEAFGSNVRIVSSPSEGYVGVQLGADSITVRLDREKFGIDATFQQTLPVMVDPVRVQTSPPFVRVNEPGEDVEITVASGNAYSDNVGDLLMATVMPEDVGLQTMPQGSVLQATVTTPQERQEYPVFLVGTWNGDTLPGEADRTDTSEISNQGEVVLDPRDRCLTPGDDVTVTAMLTGFNDNRVSWEVSGSGSLGNTTDLTAVVVADSLGTVTVTATAVEDGDVQDTVEYQVVESCLAKLWYPVASITLDGDGTYSGGGADCPEDNREDTQEARLAEPPPQPSGGIPPDGQLWIDRNELLSEAFLHNSTRHRSIRQDAQSPAQCENVVLTGSNNTSIEYEGTPDGTLSLSVDSDMSSTCSAYSNDFVECSMASSVASASGGYFLEVEEALDLRLTGELSCSNLDGFVQLLPVQGTIIRYVGGDPNTPFVPTQNPDGSVSTGVRDANGNPTNPTVLDGLTCTQANQTIPVDISFTLEAASAEQPDTVVLMLSGSFQFLSAGMEKDDFGLFIPDPSNPPPMPEPGDYQTTGNMDLSLKLEQE